MLMVWCQCLLQTNKLKVKGRVSSSGGVGRTILQGISVLLFIKEIKLKISLLSTTAFVLVGFTLFPVDRGVNLTPAALGHL